MKKSDERAAGRDLEALLPAQADGQAQEDRRKAGRIKRDEQRRQRIDQEIDVEHPCPLPDFTPAIPGGVARIVRQAVRAWKERVAKRNAMA